MNQRGFILPGGLLAYGFVALAIIAVLAGIAWKIRQSGYQAAEADLKPVIEQCAKEKVALESALQTQERAVQALKAEGEAKVAKATKGLAAATKAAQGAKNEAARLRALAGSPVTTACPAGTAVEEIRRGLGK